MPDVAAQAPPSSRKTDLDTAQASQRRTQDVCAVMRGRLSLYARYFLATIVNGPMKRGRNVFLKTADTKFVGKF